MRCSVVAIPDSGTHSAGGLRIKGRRITLWIKALRFRSNQPRQAPSRAFVIQNITAHAMTATGTAIHSSTPLITNAMSCTNSFSSLTRTFVHHRGSPGRVSPLLRRAAGGRLRVGTTAGRECLSASPFVLAQRDALESGRVEPGPLQGDTRVVLVILDSSRVLMAGQVSPLTVVIEDRQQLDGPVVRLYGVRGHRGEFGRLALTDEDGPFAE
jgi:hypothetical protein